MYFEKEYRICKKLKIPNNTNGIVRVLHCEADGAIIEDVPFVVKDGFIVIDDWEKYMGYHTVVKDGKAKYLEDLFIVKFTL